MNPRRQRDTFRTAKPPPPCAPGGAMAPAPMKAVGAIRMTARHGADRGDAA